MDLLSKWQNLSSARFIPLQASLELTNRCNERCQHCYIDDFSDDPSRTLDFDSWKVILHKLKAAGTLYVILMGGEAMLTPLFEEIAKYSSQLGFYTTLITNGLKIKSLEDAKRLKDLGIRQITFSVYSLSSELHDELTQVKGSLDRTLSALHFSREAGLQIGVNSLLTNKTIEDFPRLHSYFSELGIKVREDVTITAKFSGDLSPTKLRARPDQIIDYYRYKKSLQQQTRPEDVDASLFKEEYVCNVAKGKCAVTAYGELLGCIEVRESLGNLVQSSFDELWYSARANKWRHIKNKDLDSLESAGKSNCNHCLGMARNEHGDELAILPFSKEVHHLHERA